MKASTMRHMLREERERSAAYRNAALAIPAFILAMSVLLLVVVLHRQCAKAEARYNRLIEFRPENRMVAAKTLSVLDPGFKPRPTGTDPAEQQGCDPFEKHRAGPEGYEILTSFRPCGKWCLKQLEKRYKKGDEDWDWPERKPVFCEDVMDEEYGHVATMVIGDGREAIYFHADDDGRAWQDREINTWRGEKE